MRTDPPPSDPWAKATIPAATAAPAPAGRPAGGVVEVPRVPRRPAVDGGFGRGTDPAFGAVVRPKVTTPVALIRAKIAAVAGSRSVLARRRTAVVAGEILRLDPKILDQERHAPERPARQAVGDGLAGDAFLDQDDGVDRGVPLCSTAARAAIQQFGRA